MITVEAAVAVLCFTCTLARLEIFYLVLPSSDHSTSTVTSLFTTRRKHRFGDMLTLIDDMDTLVVENLECGKRIDLVYGFTSLYAPPFGRLAWIADYDA